MRVLLALFAALLLLSVGSGATASNSTPPRNGLIAVNGWEGIYIVDPQEGTTKLLPKTFEMSDPAWSPDGTTLAVSAPHGESSAVYTMKPDGSERRLVLDNAYSPSWSPDGKQLVVVRGGGPDGDEESTGLAIVDADGSETRTLDLVSAEGFQIAALPEWSPDGKLIAFVDAAQGMIRFVSPDGEAAPMHAVAADANGLSWSPDSTKLAFDRYVETKDGGRSVAVVLDLATGREAVFTGEQHGARSPTWSPEGDQVAFISESKRATSTSTTTTSHSCGGEDFASQLWVMSPNGTKAHRLVEGEYQGTPSWGRASEAGPAPAPVADEEPAPAPTAEQEPAPAADDLTASPKTSAAPAVTSEPAREPLAKNTDVPATGKGLIAVRGSNAIYLVDPDSAAAHKVPDTADMIAPAWSPDGSLLAVERVDDAGGSSVYTIRPDGTHAQLVVKNASAPSWSPAGDLIFVVRNECATPCEPEDDEANVRYSVRPDGRDLQRVDLEQADLQDPRELAWRGDGSPIWFFEDGSENGPGTFDTAAAAWSPDETRIAFIGALGPTDDEASADTVTAGLWIVSAEGGTPQLLLKGASGWPSWPSDGR